MKILLTAFEQFGKISNNSSLEVVKNLTSDYEIHKVILPVKLHSSYQILNEEIKNFNPEVVILCGQAASRKVISIETTAKNIITKKVSDDDEVDVNNNIIIDNASSCYYSKFPTEKALVRLISLEIPVELSSDAGEYICNSLYFKTLHYHPNIPSVFIHFPLYKGQISEEGIELEVLIKGLKEIINSL